MTMRLLKDRVLVLLPPETHQTTSGLITAPFVSPVATAGRVVLTGPEVRDVAKGDLVTFPPTAGDAIPYGGYPCLLLREQEILATVSKKEPISA